MFKRFLLLVLAFYSNEGALYFSNDIELSDEIKAHLGLRYSSFQYKGNITFREYIKSDLTVLKF